MNFKECLLGRFRVVLCVTAILLMPTLMHAQTAAVTGTVTDASGAVLVKANITATNTATGVSRSTETTDAGVYRIASLTPGIYSVAVARSGFQTAKFDNVILTVDQILTLNAQLQVSTVAQTVEVSGASIAPIDTESATISNEVNQQHITDLPLILRDPYQLVLLSPGVVQSNSGLGGFSFNGTRERNNNFLLDGVDNNDTEVPGIPGGITSLNPDETQEFRVLTNNFSAEYGRDNGGIIDVITKSGTNALHGDAYWFGRYDAFGARDFFNHIANTPKNPYVRNIFGSSIGGPIKKDKTFFFGNYEGRRFVTNVTNESTVPTPAFKTGMFTYTNPQTGVSQFIDISTPSSPNNGLGLPPDPIIQKILGLYPNPNGQVLDGITGQLFFPSASRERDDDFTIKLDQILSSKHTLSVRYIYNRFQDPNPFHSDFLPGGLGAISTFQRTQGASASFVSTFKPTLLNEFRFGANRTNLQFNCTGTGLFDSFGFIDPTGRGADFSSNNLSGFGCQGLGDSNGQARFTGTYHTSDNITWTVGNHSFKFGGEFRDVYSNSFDNFGSRAAFDFNPLFNFGIPSLMNVAGNVDTTPLEDLGALFLGFTDLQSQTQFFDKSGNTRLANDLRGFRQREVAPFFNDSWKILSNFTLNYGLRWEWYGVPYEVNGLFSTLYQNPSLAAPFTFTVLNQAHNQLYKDDYKNFQPRVGFAWDPFKTGKTSIRGGAGIFSDRVYGNLIGDARGNPPLQQSFSNITLAPVSALSAPATVPTSATVGPLALIFPDIFDYNLREPRSVNWNLGIERQLIRSLTFEANYVGTHGTHILRTVDGNPPQPNLVSQLETFCANPSNSFGCSQGTLQHSLLYFGAELGLLPFDAVNNNAFFQAFIDKSIAKSNYDGLQLKVTEQAFHGLQIQGAYTYAHALDDGSDPLVAASGNRNFPRNSLNLAPEYGNSDFDVRHRGVINFLYQPPIGRGASHLSSGFVGRAFEGLELSGILSFQSGLPYDIFGVTDNQHTGLSDRAEIVGNTSIPKNGNDAQTGPSKFAFGAAAFGQRANINRNAFFGPGINNWDVSLIKSTTIKEALKLQLRAEFYNLFNRVHFAQPDNNIAGSFFGQSQSQVGNSDGTTGARQMQFAAKLIF